MSGCDTREYLKVVGVEVVRMVEQMVGKRVEMDNGSGLSKERR